MTLPSLSDYDKSDVLETILNTIQDGIILLDREFNVILINRWMEQRHQSRMPLVGKKCYSAFHSREEPCIRCPYLDSLKTGRPHTLVMNDASDLCLPGWYEVSAYSLEDPDGSMVGAIEHVKDITERKQAEELLRDEVSRRRLLVEQCRDGIVVLDTLGNVYEANREFARMLGYSLDEIYRLHIWDWDTQWDREELLKLLETDDDAGRQFETRQRRKDGTTVEVEISSNGAVYAGQKLIFCICRDITEKKALQEQIHQLAIRDPLTEIYNRRYIFERLEELAAEHARGGASFCVSILDIDYFKTVNDTHGHLAGDFALKEFTQAVGSMIRPYDLFGRFGGEEFVIVSRNAGGAETAAMIDRIMGMVRETAFSFEGRDIRFTFSCGLADSAEFAADAFSIEGMVTLADHRLYDAKARGRDRCVGPMDDWEAISRPVAAGDRLPPTT